MKNLKNLSYIFNTDLFMKCLKEQFLDFFQIDHINNCKTDNRLKNLQLLTPTKNNQKSNNKAIISINIKTYEKKNVSITKAAIELGICVSYISQICNQRKHHKSATSKKDGKKIHI